MPSQALKLRLLGECLPDRKALVQARGIIEKVEKCCTALKRNLNLADILRDGSNLQSIVQSFGQEYEAGMQLFLKWVLEEYTARTFTIHQPIQGRKKVEFLRRSVGGWRQFDVVLSLQMPDLPKHPVLLINPVKPQ